MCCVGCSFSLGDDPVQPQSFHALQGFQIKSWFKVSRLWHDSYRCCQHPPLLLLLLFPKVKTLQIADGIPDCRQEGKMLSWYWCTVVTPAVCQSLCSRTSQHCTCSHHWRLQGVLQQDPVLLWDTKAKPQSLLSRPLLVLKKSTTLGEQAAETNVAQTDTSFSSEGALYLVFLVPLEWIY